MIPAIRAEFRKLLSIRSTYIITALSTALVILFGFYIFGYKLAGADLRNPLQLASSVTGAISTVAVFGAIIAVLLWTHEYRYNTIMYTLTASNARRKVFLAKFIVISTYAVLFTIFICVLAPLLSYWGVHLHGHALVPQTLHVGNLLWRSLVYGWGMAMAGFVFAALLRNQVAAVVSLFVVPNVVESLLTLLLKNNGVYLPFSALNQVIGNQSLSNGHLTPLKGTLVFGSYLAVAWVITFILFVRRDAN